jgi:hypothetical protein
LGLVDVRRGIRNWGRAVCGCDLDADTTGEKETGIVGERMLSEAIDQSGPEIFFDGVSDAKIIEGVTRFALHVRRDGDSVVVARLAVPLSELPEVIQELVILLTRAAKVIIRPPLSS